MQKISAIILAGGQSRRMGRDKALIDFNGRPIIAHVIETLRELSDEVIVVSNRPVDLAGPLPPNARVARDASFSFRLAWLQFGASSKIGRAHV